MRLPAVLQRRDRAIPLAGAFQLRPQARRTLAVRALLGVLAAAALVAAILVSRDAQGQQTTLFGGGGSGVLVVDLSASIGAVPHARIGRALRRLIAARSSFGLVFFSDVAYEALPPGTRWTEMRPLLRFFTRRPPPAPVGRPGVPAPRQPVRDNPFTALRGGTRISMGLRLARNVLKREGDTQAGVLLISDLDNSLFDEVALTRALSEYQADRIPVRVLGLSPARDDAEFFERVLGEQALVSSPELAPRRALEEANRFEVSDSFPTALAALAVLLLLALAANEHWSAQLHWRGERA